MHINLLKLYKKGNGTNWRDQRAIQRQGESIHVKWASNSIVHI